MPRISDMLGRYFSGNGDFGAVAFQSRRVTEPASAHHHRRCRLPATSWKGTGFFYIEDGGIPEILRRQLAALSGRDFPTPANA